MEYKYYRELKHNYLIVKSEEEACNNKESYQVRILENRNLKGFLRCDLRTINNEQFLYYEIDSLQSLKDRFSSRGMDRQQLIKLFKDLKKALEGLSEYLLGIENVVLDTRSIYTDYATGEFLFMYYPFSTEPSDFGHFIDDLFDLVDHDDEKAVELVYSCSEKAQGGNVLILDVLSSAIEESKDIEEQPDTQDLGKISELPEMEAFDDVEEDSSEPVDRKVSEKKLSTKVQLIFSFLFFVLLGVMVHIRKGYILTAEENVLSVIVMIVSMITGLASFLSAIKDMMKNGVISGKEKPAAIRFTKEADDDSVDLTAYMQTIKVTPSGDMTKNRASEERKELPSSMPDCGETVVLSKDDEEEREITLYSRNADKTIRIPLGVLPVTIGKLEGCVDKVISDKSISRIHCRFDRDEEGRIMLTDLNSTNGTFRNGLKLNPQEKNYIEEGDEVKIGRICFDCR